MMETWVEFLIDHYTERLKQETRLPARSFIRQTLSNLKRTNDAEPTSESIISDCHNPSLLLHNQTKASGWQKS